MTLMISEFALVQNAIGIGGRSKVLAEAIKTLAVPDTRVHLYTFSGNESFNQFTEYYDLKSYNVELETFPKLNAVEIGTLYEQPALNFQIRKHIGEYDYVFNSNNCLNFLPQGPTYIHYFHLPNPAIPHTNPRYSENPLLQFYSYPLLLQHRIFGGKKSLKGSVLTNSQFTANWYKKVYVEPPDEVVYPPSIENVKFDGICGSGVASLGSFHPNKRQLFQLMVAKQLPEIDFTLLGHKSSDKYYEKCLEYCQREGLSNVKIKLNASRDTVREILCKSKVFLHSMRNEPFGISTVEAINHGCVPVVHDSGGQREIVAEESLRFNGLEECRATIQTETSKNNSNWAGDIPNQLENYTGTVFRQTLSKYKADTWNE